jgi:hypothetical protein
VSVKLVVKDGVPEDRGKVLELSGRTEAFVGRGPGMHLSIADPAWPANGRLRVHRDGGVYRVTNQVGYPIFIVNPATRTHVEIPTDGEPVIWYDSDDLCPTPKTTIGLQTGAATQPDLILPEPPGETNDRWKNLGYIGFIILAVPVFVFLMLYDSSGGKPAIDVRSQVRKLSDDLDLLVSRPAPDRSLVAALREIKQARFDEAAQKPGDAYQHYLAARTLIDQTKPDETTKEIVERARAVVRDRIDDLGPRAGRR